MLGDVDGEVMGGGDGEEDKDGYSKQVCSK